MKVIKTILRAFALGIGVGVLLAPRAGSETRRLLSERINNALDSAAGLTDKLDRSSGESSVPAQHSAGGGSTREVGSTDAVGA